MNFCKDCVHSHEEQYGEYLCRNTNCLKFPTGNPTCVLTCRKEGGPCGPEGKYYEKFRVCGVVGDTVDDRIALVVFCFAFMAVLILGLCLAV